MHAHTHKHTLLTCFWLVQNLENVWKMCYASCNQLFIYFFSVHSGRKLSSLARFRMQCNDDDMHMETDTLPMCKIHKLHPTLMSLWWLVIGIKNLYSMYTYITLGFSAGVCHYPMQIRLDVHTSASFPLEFASLSAQSLLSPSQLAPGRFVHL